MREHTQCSRLSAHTHTHTIAGDLVYDASLDLYVPQSHGVPGHRRARGDRSAVGSNATDGSSSSDGHDSVFTGTFGDADTSAEEQQAQQDVSSSARQRALSPLSVLRQRRERDKAAHGSASHGSSGGSDGGGDGGGDDDDDDDGNEDGGNRSDAEGESDQD